MISVDEAWKKICGKVAMPSISERALDDCLDYVLAQPIQAPINLPPFDNSAMDGYAIKASDTNEADQDVPVKLKVNGEVAAGDWAQECVESGTAMQIMTGAALPSGADSVLMLEAARLREGLVEIREPVSLGRHVRKCGEDIREGETLLDAGTRLNAQRIGLLANSGVASISVYEKPKASLIATGSELVVAGEYLSPGKIYDSNRIVLRSLLEQTGSECADLGIAPDDPKEITELIRRGLDSDLLLISGGVSVGAHDHVKQVLKDLGMEQLFWRVKMKPGKPLLCGRVGSTWVFGLPGNPISCVVGFLVFIEPLIRRLQGEVSAQPRFKWARLSCSVRKKDERRHFMTATLISCDDGSLEATPTHKQGSAMMQSLADADCFAVIPEDRTSMDKGEIVKILKLND